MLAAELLNISKRFGAVTALDGVSLSLARGERVAVVGENGAGKSSLMNVLYGLYQPDAGQVRIGGEEVRLASPRDALARGVGMVHQHFALAPTLTVTENVVLGAEPARLGRLDRDRARAHARAACERLGFTLDLDARVGELTVGSQQKVEILKALWRGATTLILDEPTAVLTPGEAHELVAVMRSLAKTGVTVVLVSHRLTEVLAFAERVVVMRRGRLVAEVPAASTTPDALAALMVGELRSDEVQRVDRAPGEVVLSLRDARARGLHGVSLELRAGEILGIAGVDGNGQRELAEVLTGLRPLEGGAVVLRGSPRPRWTPGAARDAGVASVPEDRLRQALVPGFTVEENVALGRHHRPPFARGPLIDRRGRREAARALVAAHDVRPADELAAATALSGGNQQKLVVGRALAGRPAVLVAVQPTRGLDLAAVRAVRTHLLAERARGCAVLVVSLDLEEVLALSDRVVVLSGGRVVAEQRRGAYDEAALGLAMLGGLTAREAQPR